MQGVEIEVLDAALAWMRAQRRVYLVTVVATFGSSPRPPGAMMAVCDDGRFVGSVSGGCIEKELTDRINDTAPAVPERVSIGVEAKQMARFGLPCGGTIELVVEPVQAVDTLQAAVDALTQRRVVRRCLDLRTGSAHCEPAGRDADMDCNDEQLVQVFGPRWRILVIGANQLTGYVAAMAGMLGYQVMVCESRASYRQNWQDQSVTLLADSPDEVVATLQPDRRTAVLALSHEPNLDDLALMEALRSPAFYVGALASRGNSAKRLDRLRRHFGLDEAELARLQSPVGLPLGGRSPPEIAVSIMAAITAARHRPGTAASTSAEVAGAGPA
jgi:xanthine dehydrogenase accessory factor